jgi:hypothetical protein
MNPTQIQRLADMHVADGSAVQITIEPSLNGARVKGWICAKDKRSAFLACKQIAAKFGRESLGAWIDGDGTECPFEFDTPRATHAETFASIYTRTLATLDSK